MQSYVLTWIVGEGHIIKRTLPKVIIYEKQIKSIYILNEIYQNRVYICFHENLTILLKLTNEIFKIIKLSCFWNLCFFLSIR